MHDVMKYQSKIILDNENTLKNARQITKRFYKVIIIIIYKNKIIIKIKCLKMNYSLSIL